MSVVLFKLTKIKAPMPTKIAMKTPVSLIAFKTGFGQIPHSFEPVLVYYT